MKGGVYRMLTLFHRIIILHVNKSFIYMLKNKKIKLT